jgi:hypothetical protein
LVGSRVLAYGVVCLVPLARVEEWWESWLRKAEALGWESWLHKAEAKLLAGNLGCLSIGVLLGIWQMLLVSGGDPR